MIIEKGQYWRKLENKIFRGCLKGFDRVGFRVGQMIEGYWVVQFGNIIFKVEGFLEERKDSLEMVMRNKDFFYFRDEGMIDVGEKKSYYSRGFQGNS